MNNLVLENVKEDISIGNLILDNINGKVTKEVPIWIMRQAGRYLPEYKRTFSKGKSFLDVCYNVDLATEITLQPIQRFNFDAAIFFSDILVLPYAMGYNVEFIPNVGPKISYGENLIKDINFENLLQNLNKPLEILKSVKKSLASKALIGFVGAPWTVAAYIVEGGASRNFLKVKKFLHENRDIFTELINMITDATIFYLKKQIEAGADVVQIFDSNAGVLSDEAFDYWVISPTKRIVESLSGLNCKIIGYPQGAGVRYLRYVQETKVDVIGVDHSMPLEWCRKNLIYEHDSTTQTIKDFSCSSFNKLVTEVLEGNGYTMILYSDEDNNLFFNLGII